MSDFEMNSTYPLAAVSVALPGYAEHASASFFNNSLIQHQTQPLQQQIE